MRHEVSIKAPGRTSMDEDLLDGWIREAEPTFLLRDWRQTFARLIICTLSVVVLA